MMLLLLISVQMSMSTSYVFGLLDWASLQGFRDSISARNGAGPYSLTTRMEKAAEPHRTNHSARFKPGGT